MNKLLLIALLVLYSSLVYAQDDMFIYKKKHTTIIIFTKGSYIAFRQKNDEWMAGYITKVQNDSFYLKPMAIIWIGGHPDTLLTVVQPFAVNDIYAMPKQGFQIDYIGDRFNINTGGGHQHFYWVKGGWLFRTGGAGYILLNAFNGITHNNFSFSDKSLYIAAAVFAFGELLKLHYKPTHIIGGRYHIQYVRFEGKK